MKFAIISCTLASLASLAVAGPLDRRWDCLSQSAAEKLVAEYQAVIAQQPSDLGNASVTAAAITNPDYQEISDSANSQIGIPLGSVTVPSQAVFIVSSQAQPPVQFDTIAVYVACRDITWQWIDTNFGSGQYEVKGFHLFQVGTNGKLDKTYFEFNSVAGALDTGWTAYYPNGTQVTSL